MRRVRVRWRITAVVGTLATAIAACATAGTGVGAEVSTIRLYSSVTEDTVQAVIDAYVAEHPDRSVDVFRAPTGEVAARIAAEQREGGIQADVLWLTDPLSIQQYAGDGLLAEWTPSEREAVPAAFRSDAFFGTRVLDLVIVHGAGLADPPADWWDLARSNLGGEIAVPDPGFAGSAFAALAYFALTPHFGFDFYRELRDNGGVQVSSPGDVVTGVAEGQFAAGITLDRTARDAIDEGSPLSMVWPESGAIALFSPVAVVAGSDVREAAESFAGFLLTREAQQEIADTGWQAVRDDVAWEHGGPEVTIDWSQAFDRQQELLDDYHAIFER